jgi:dTDP-4-amino-4,6-dideoxygalactose transaminase
MNQDKPAILGGIPIFNDIVPIIQPTLPSLELITDQIEDILNSRMITNSKFVSQLENEVSDFLKVKNVIALSNCTTGLMLLLNALEMKGEIITPSFSFSATCLSIIWAGAKPILVDCHPTKWTIDPESIKEKINSKTSGIIATHIFGNPCDIQTLEEICQDHKIKLIFDSAHGAGAIYHDKRIGNFGNGESFSMSPTKVLTAGEGGLVTTNDDDLARKIKIGRNYANPGDYNTEYIGLSGRLAEFNAILALYSLKILEKNVKNRQTLVKEYKNNLDSIPGIRFQSIEKESLSSYKDFSILINENKFGVSRDKLYIALEKENIMTKKYFDPPIHEQKAFIPFLKDQNLNLKNTNKVAKKIISLPIYSHMKEEKVRKICRAILKVHRYHKEINEYFK